MKDLKRFRPQIKIRKCIEVRWFVFGWLRFVWFWSCSLSINWEFQCHELSIPVAEDYHTASISTKLYQRFRFLFADNKYWSRFLLHPWNYVSCRFNAFFHFWHVPFFPDGNLHIRSDKVICHSWCIVQQTSQTQSYLLFFRLRNTDYSWNDQSFSTDYQFSACRACRGWGPVLNALLLWPHELWIGMISWVVQEIEDSYRVLPSLSNVQWFGM